MVATEPTPVQRTQAQRMGERQRLAFHYVMAYSRMLRCPKTEWENAHASAVLLELDYQEVRMEDVAGDDIAQAMRREVVALEVARLRDQAWQHALKVARD